MSHLPKGICFSQFLPNFLPFFHYSFSLPVSSQFHSIVSLLATCTSAYCPLSFILKPTKKGPFITLPTFFPQILGFAVAAQLPSPYSTPLSCTYLPTSGLGQGCLYCQTQALYTLPTDSSSLDAVSKTQSPPVSFGS